MFDIDPNQIYITPQQAKELKEQRLPYSYLLYDLRGWVDSVVNYANDEYSKTHLEQMKAERAGDEERAAAIKKILADLRPRQLRALEFKLSLDALDELAEYVGRKLYYHDVTAYESILSGQPRTRHEFNPDQPAQILNPEGILNSIDLETEDGKHLKGKPVSVASFRNLARDFLRDWGDEYIRGRPQRDHIDGKPIWDFLEEQAAKAPPAPEGPEDSAQGNNSNRPEEPPRRPMDHALRSPSERRK